MNSSDEIKTKIISYLKQNRETRFKFHDNEYFLKLENEKVLIRTKNFGDSISGCFSTFAEFEKWLNELFI